MKQIKRIQDWIYELDFINIKMSDVQRNYVWKPKQARELLEEFQKNEISFLGGIAYIDDTAKNKKIIISDGCQRLTTIFLIAKIYQKEVEAIIGQPYPIKSLEYVSKKDKDQMRIIMNTNFKSCIRPSDFIYKLKQQRVDEKSNIYKNFKELLYKVYKNDKNIKITAQHFLNCRLYDNEIPLGCNEVETFINLNSKGQAVSLAEIVKAYCPDVLDGNTYISFDKLKEDDFGTDKEFTRFLRKISCYNPGGASRGSSSKAKDVEFYNEHMNTFDDLKPYAEMYLDIVNNYKYVKLLIEHDIWPAPVSTFMFSVYRSNALSKNDKDSILNFVCKWLYKNIPYKNAGQGEHSDFQRSLGGALKDGKPQDEQPPFTLLSEALKNLEEQQNNSPQISLKYVEDILNNYLTKNYTDWDVRTEKGLNYGLGKNYIKSVFNDLNYDANILNSPEVEHIWAQKYETDTNTTYIHKLGNLTFLSKNDNDRIGSLEPNEKLNHEIYKESKFQPTKDLPQKYSQWTETEIDKRHEELVKAWIDVMK